MIDALLSTGADVTAASFARAFNPGILLPMGCSSADELAAGRTANPARPESPTMLDFRATPRLNNLDTNLTVRFGLDSHDDIHRSALYADIRRHPVAGADAGCAPARVVSTGSRQSSCAGSRDGRVGRRRKRPGSRPGKRKTTEERAGADHRISTAQASGAGHRTGPEQARRDKKTAGRARGVL